MVVLRNSYYSVKVLLFLEYYFQNSNVTVLIEYLIILVNLGPKAIYWANSKFLCPKFP